MDADGRHYPAGRWFSILLESSMTTRRRCHDGKLPTSCSYNILYGHEITTTDKLHPSI
eukprot:SAG11_NODE_1836_length_4187_cov_69.990460_2_plen_58_part_00